MATILSMPKWGLAMKTGLVVEWLKKQGETIQQGEPIVEIESEKATNEVDAPSSGTLRLVVVNEGESAPISEPIAVITAPGEELSDEEVGELLRQDAEVRRQKAEALAKPRTATKSSTPAPSRGTLRTTGTSTGGRVNASPIARRLAQELGVDLATVKGTGPGGMIGREDVQNAAKEKQASSEEVPSEEAEEKVVDVGGVATHCLIAGPAKAPHIVFVHGLGGSLATWSLNLQAFAERFRICAVDLAGAGDSDKPQMDYSVTSLADFLARFLTALGSEWQRVSIVGHSLGGAVALAFAQHYPERVEQLVLVDSAGLGPEVNNSVLELMHTEPTPEHIRSELSYFFSQPGMIQQALVDQLYQQRIQPGAREALIAMSDAAFGGGQQHIRFQEALTVVPSMVLIVWGDKDAIIPVAHAQTTNRSWQSQVEIFADCGHCPHIEKAADFNALVASFLSKSSQQLKQ